MSTLPPEARRMRVRYAKDGRLAYLGHLEVMNTIMRSVRRSGLPFEVGNGFARRMRIQFSQALPVGASSAAEYFDLMVPRSLDADEALRQLVQASPRALAPNAARLLPRRVPALEAWAGLSRWEVVVRGHHVDAPRFKDLLEGVRAAGAIEYLRGDKPRRIALENTLVSCEVRPAVGGVDLTLVTRSTAGGSLRPAVLVQAVTGHAPLRVKRVGQWHEDGHALVDPMDVEV